MGGARDGAPGGPSQQHATPCARGQPPHAHAGVQSSVPSGEPTQVGLFRACRTSLAEANPQAERLSAALLLLIYGA